ncbi:hypothetical protein ACFLTG_03580 [Chloroflexota bacterium]
MDFSELGENFPIIVLAIGLALLQIFFIRKRKPAVTQQGIIQSLLSDIRVNQALVENYHLLKKPEKFEAVSWQRSKSKLDFLSQSLQGVLSDTFTPIEDFNQQIEAARKHKSTSYMVNVDVGKVKGPLAKSRQGLEEWLTTNIETKEPPTKYPGFLESFFGGR